MRIGTSKKWWVKMHRIAAIKSELESAQVATRWETRCNVNNSYSDLQRNICIYIYIYFACELRLPSSTLAGLAGYKYKIMNHERLYVFFFFFFFFLSFAFKVFVSSLATVNCQSIGYKLIAWQSHMRRTYWFDIYIYSIIKWPRKIVINEREKCNTNLM